MSASSSATWFANARLEPGGNRVELFSGGYPIHGPDWPPVSRDGANLEKAVVWCGGMLPDTFFNVATPPPRPPGIGRWAGQPGLDRDRR